MPRPGGLELGPIPSRGLCIYNNGRDERDPTATVASLFIYNALLYFVCVAVGACCLVPLCHSHILKITEM